MSVKEKTAESEKLKAFMQENFWFSALKKAGVFPKTMKYNDYEGQAKRICHLFSLESIYEWGTKEIRCHISYATPIKKGEHIEEHRPFITTIFPQTPDATFLKLKPKNDGT